VLLLGIPSVAAAAGASGLAGSERRRLLGLPVGGVLAPVDPDLERRLADVLVAAATDGMLVSAASVARGGLLAALVRGAVAGGTGVRLDLPVDVTADGRRLAQLLFSEAPGRVLVSVADDDVAALTARAAAADVPVVRLGTVGGDAIVLGAAATLGLAAVTAAHRAALPRAMGEDA
jgi:phosphoribosylformylglycinamidine (FGAM) synthase-like enzyme